MWPLLIFASALAVVFVSMKKKPKAAEVTQAMQSSVMLKYPALYAQIRSALEMDLKTGGAPLQAGTTIDQLATFYTQAYASMSNDELLAVVKNAYANKYALTGKILDNRDQAPTGPGGISISL